jgi:hypothetical protein
LKGFGFDRIEVNVLKGHGFSRANKPQLETWALAPEGIPITEETNERNAQQTKSRKDVVRPFS